MKDGITAHADMLTLTKMCDASKNLSASNFPAGHNLGMEIGDRIRKARLAAGLTQVQLAAALGVNKSAVAQWESPASRKGITTPNLLKVAAILGVSIGELTGEAETADRMEISQPDEIALVRLYRMMAPEHQRTHLELFRVSVSIAHGAKTERHPANGQGAPPRRPRKQSA